MGMAQNLLSYMWGHEHPLRNDAQQDFIIMPARFDKSKLMETLKHGQNHGKIMAKKRLWYGYQLPSQWRNSEFPS
jgi:hypothetical protein